jgi:hypothetical protein
MNHPNRSRPNFMFIENGYAYFVTIDRETGFRSPVQCTCLLHHNRYVRIDDGRELPQLCKGAQLEGTTLIYHDDDQLARDCHARLFKTRAGFDRAVEIYQTVDDWIGEDVS